MDDFSGRRSVSPDRVEDFLREYGIDDHAANALRDCSPAVQAAVIERGALDNARNPSSVLLARIRKASSEGSRAPPSPRDGRLAGRVEEFLRQNPVDDQAADLLRNCNPEVQDLVMQKGVSTARNKSSALMARVRDAEREVMRPASRGRSREHRHDVPSHYIANGSPEGFCSLPLGLVDELEHFVRQHARGETMGWATHLLDEVCRAKGPAPLRAPRAPDNHTRGRYDNPHSDNIGDKVEAFLRANAVDEEAADALRRCEPDVAQAVMDKGISTARNPSSALLARIRDERPRNRSRHGQRRDPRYERHRESGPRYATESRSRSRRVADDMAEVQAFIRSAGVDERAADALLRCTPEVRRFVMEKGVAGARNPSSALLARIRDADGRGGGR